MGRTACTEPQCLYKGDLYLFTSNKLNTRYGEKPELLNKFYKPPRINVSELVYGDRLCGLVVRVSGYRYRGPWFDSRRYQIF